MLLGAHKTVLLLKLEMPRDAFFCIQREKERITFDRGDWRCYGNAGLGVPVSKL